MKHKVTSPHDKLFRASMSHPEVARDFLSTHLPSEMSSKIDLKALHICPNTFIDEELKLTESDVLIKATIADGEGYIYVLAEHQSTQDQWMPYRLLKYMLKIWDYHRQHSKKRSILPFPVIIPVVFYTGARKYRAPRAIWELCGEQAELMRAIISEPFHLVDVNLIPESSLTSRQWSGTMEFLMRHRFRQHLSQELEKIAVSFNTLMLEDNSQFVLQLLTYIVVIDEEHRSEKELIELLQGKISPKVGGEIMGLADRIMERGMEKGIEKGREKGREEGREEGELNKSLEIARNMLFEGCEPVFIAKITQLPMDQIKALQKEIG